MIVSRSIVLLGGPLLIVLIGLAMRPRVSPRARASPAKSRTRRWSWVAVASFSALVSLPLGLAVVIVPVMWQHWSHVQSRIRITRNISAGFPDALDLLVLSIRAGYLPAQAIGEITAYVPCALRPSFSAVDEALQRGDRFADALNTLRVQLGSIAQPLVDSLAAADRYGLPMAPVLERLSFEARQQRRRDTDAAARELPVRLALPLVICTLPSFVLLAIVPLLLGALSSLHV